MYGELLNTLHLYRERLGDLHPEIQEFVADLADAAAEGWRGKDAGMWEMRGEPQHHLSSKVMCWTALDRAVKLAPALGRYPKTEAWAEERDRIRDAILDRGWSEKRQAYAQAFDSDELDAAALLMPILGFLPADDQRMRSTIEAIARDLTEDGMVLRYRNEAEGVNPDGLTGEEGTFVICSFWLVSCLAKAGEVERAEALFDRLAGYANDLGLLAEEIDTRRGELLGNFPQAFSHVGLINAAAEIDAARGRSAKEGAKWRDYDVIIIGRRRSGRALRRRAGEGRQADRDRGTRARRRRVLLLGVHAVEDDAAARRGADGRTPRARRGRGDLPATSTSKRHSDGATTWCRATTT